MPSILSLFIVCPLVFLAGFVDAVAGGGGIIALPAFMLAGLGPHLALGTNKVVSSFGMACSTWQYLKNGQSLLGVGIPAAIGAAFGAFTGSQLALLASEELLGGIMLAALPLVAIFLVTRRDLGQDEAKPKPYRRSTQIILAALIGYLIGIYDGMVGPGTGTFLILGFSLILGLNLLQASGSAKLTNAASGIASMVVMVCAGEVYYPIVLPAIFCNVLGSYLGSRYALRGGSKKVRRMMFVVLGLLFVKIGYDLVGSLS